MCYSRFTNILTLLVMALLCVVPVGCKKSSSDDSHDTTKVGRLSLASHGDSVSEKARAVASATFDVGDISHTTTYLFLLRNTGSAPVTDIELSSENSAVTVTPSVIRHLSPEGGDGMSPVIQVTIRHGTGTGGFGTYPVLAAGPLEFGISVRGTSAGTAVAVDAAIEGQVQLANFTLVNNLPVEFGNYDSIDSADLMAATSMNVQFDDGRHDALLVEQDARFGTGPDAYTGTYDYFSVHNTGSVPLYVRISNRLSGSDLAPVPGTGETITVQPGMFEVLHLKRDPTLSSTWSTYWIPISVWSAGTVISPDAASAIDDDLVRIFVRARVGVPLSG